MRAWLLTRSLFAILVAANLIAQDQDNATLVPPVRLIRLPPRIGVIGEAQVALDQAIAMSLANNNDIDGSRIDREIANINLAGSFGVWDPLASATSAFLKQINPIASALGGSATGAVLTRTWQTDPTLSGSTPWLGGSYRVDFNNQRTYTNNTFVTLNPQYPSSLNFQYIQPLFRGFRYDANRRSIDVARKNREISDVQFRLRVMQIVQQTEQAYWELVYAYNNLQVQVEAVEIGRQQDESNRRQQQQGLLAPIDVVAAQTQLATFESAAYNAQTALTRAENNLKTLILADRNAPQWSAALVPVTPPDLTPPLTPVQDAVTSALANRPERMQSQLSADINTKDLQLAREALKPQVDLVAGYTRTGLAGIRVPTNPFPGFPNTVPPALVGSYGQSLSNLLAGDFPTTQVQLRISMPIRNRAAEAGLARSIADSRRLRNQQEQIEQTIEAEVRNAMQAMQSAQLRLDATRLQRRSAEEQYNSEQRQFRAGTSTLFLVQQRQNAMITARSQERRAEADLGSAVAAYEMATGSILTAHNVNAQ